MVAELSEATDTYESGSLKADIVGNFTVSISSNVPIKLDAGELRYQLLE